MKTKELILESLLKQIQTELENCDECKVNVPRWMAVLNQSLKDYDELLISLNEYNLFDVVFVLTDQSYEFGVIQIYRLNGDTYVDAELVDEVCRITLSDVPKWGGYCDCSPDAEGYDNRYGCCGYGCDWDAPRIDVCMVKHLGSNEFKGCEHDIWDLEDKYNNIDLVKKKELEESAELSRLLREKEYLETRIKELTK